MRERRSRLTVDPGDKHCSEIEIQAGYKALGSGRLPDKEAWGWVLTLTWSLRGPHHTTVSTHQLYTKT
jgi:hypothetical protein